MSRALRIGMIVALALAAGGLALFLFLPPKRVQSNSLARTARTAIPGDPQNAVKAFRNLYAFLIAYRKAHGSLPRANNAYLLELSETFEGGAKLAKSDVYCIDVDHPDYLDSRPIERDPRYGLAWNFKRPDGTPKPDFPKAGERDLWAYSRHYERIGWTRDGKASEVYGYRVGLFSDGSVEVVPSEKLIGVRRSANSWFTHFPGVTGIPKGSLPINEMQEKVFSDVQSGPKPNPR